MKQVLLYRRSVDARSGAGQLIRMQADGLRDAGEQVRIVCQHGGLRFFLRTGWPVRRVSRKGVGKLNRSTAHVVVDHEMQLPGADLVFVHNLATEGNRYQERADWVEAAAGEAAFFDALTPATSIVANSRLTKAALTRHFDVEPGRILVLYPGFRSEKFRASRALALRSEARAALRVDDSTPLIGFVTSGDFQTRGLDTFLASAERIVAERPDARFLVVGSKRLPDWAATHPLVAKGGVHYRPKNSRPELWLAALDIFLYASRFETFGMVVSEAQALGVPVLTSRRVGASECLPGEYSPWLLERPDSDEFAARTLMLLADEDTRRTLTTAGVENASALDQEHYVRQSVATILDQKR